MISSGQIKNDKRSICIGIFLLTSPIRRLHVFRLNGSQFSLTCQIYPQYKQFTGIPLEFFFLGSYEYLSSVFFAIYNKHIK